MMLNDEQDTAIVYLRKLGPQMTQMTQMFADVPACG